MTKYAAFLRGIGPSNPNMRGAKLKETVESLGFQNVSILLSSGNIIFAANTKDQAKLEARLEKVWPEKLGFNSMTIIRSQEQLQALVDADPYKGAQHGNISKTYQLVTLFKTPPATLPDGNYQTVLGVNSLCSSIDNSGDLRTPDFMAKLDKTYGKTQITSRTWLTIQRVLKKLNEI